MMFIDSVYTGAAEDMAHSSLRFGMGRFTTEAEVDYVVEKIVSVVQRLRDMRFVLSPLACLIAILTYTSQSALGDGPGGHRYQHHQLGSALIQHALG